MKLFLYQESHDTFRIAFLVQMAPISNKISIWNDKVKL